MSFRKPSIKRSFKEDNPDDYHRIINKEMLYKRGVKPVHKQTLSETFQLTSSNQEIHSGRNSFITTQNNTESDKDSVQTFKELDQPEINELRGSMESIQLSQQQFYQKHQNRLTLVKKQLLQLLEEDSFFDVQDSSEFPQCSNLSSIVLSQNNDYQSTSRFTEMVRSSNNSNFTETGPGSSFVISDQLENSDYMPDFMRYIKRRSANSSCDQGNKDVIQKALRICLENDEILRKRIQEALSSCGNNENFALLLRNSQEFAGVYWRVNDELQKLIGAEGSPDIITAEMVKSVYKIDLEAGELITVPLFSDCDAVLLRNYF